MGSFWCLKLFNEFFKEVKPRWFFHGFPMLHFFGGVVPCVFQYCSICVMVCFTYFVFFWGGGRRARGFKIPSKSDHHGFKPFQAKLHLFVSHLTDEHDICEV